jgi:hypothetical protein
VRACDSIIGPDPDLSPADDTPEPNLVVVIDGVRQDGAEVIGTQP